MKYHVQFVFRSLSLLLVLALALAGCAGMYGGPGTSHVESKDGSHIAYGVQGEGDTTLVFVHCWTCSHAMWQPQLDRFAKDHRVVWLDLAGHGLSDSRRNRYSMRAFGEDVAAVVERISAERVVLVGHSMGGPVALEAADLLGERVVGIVGVDTFYTPFEYPEDPQQVEAFVKPFKDDFAAASQQMVQSMFVPDADPALKQQVMGQFTGADPQMGVSAMYEVFGWYPSRGKVLLEKHQSKLHNINGGGNHPGGPLHPSVVLIPGVGHFVPQMKPQAFNRALAGILVGL